MSPHEPSWPMSPRAADERFDLIWHLQERMRLRALAAENTREAAALDADTAARRAEVALAVVLAARAAGG